MTEYRKARGPGGKRGDYIYIPALWSADLAAETRMILMSVTPIASSRWKGDYGEGNETTAAEIAARREAMRLRASQSPYSDGN
jgi:hypothetical protein